MDYSKKKSGGKQQFDEQENLEHRLREMVRGHGWWIILTCFLTSMFLGFMGFKTYSIQHPSEDTKWTTLDCVYGAIQLIIMESGGFSAGLKEHKNWMLEWARFLVPLFGILALLETLAKIAADKLDQIIIAVFFRNHIIICGLGEKGKRLAKAYYDKGYRVIGVDLDKQNENLSSLRLHGSSLFRFGIKTVTGNAADRLLLNRLQVQRAKKLYAMTTNDDVNLKIGVSTRKVLHEIHGVRKPKLDCYLHVMDERLFDNLLRYDPFIDTLEFNAEVFNFYEQVARYMFKEHCPDIRVPAVCREGQLKILLLGAGWLGEKLLQQMIRTGQFENRTSPSITVMDMNSALLADVERRLNNCVSKHPDNHFVEIDFKLGDARHLDKAFFKANPVDMIYVCAGDDISGFDIGLHLSDVAKCPVVVAMPQHTGIADIFNKCCDAKQGGLFLYKTIEETIPLIIDDKRDEIARKVHEAWAGKTQTKPAAPQGHKQTLRDTFHRVWLWIENRGGYAQPDTDEPDPWKSLAPDNREASRSSADHLEIKLRMIGCELVSETDDRKEYLLSDNDKDELLFEEIEHRRFCAERLLQGWSLNKSNDERDEEQMLHPYLKPYKNLNDNQNKKNRDYFTKSINKLPEIGLKIIKSKLPSTAGR